PPDPRAPPASRSPGSPAPAPSSSSPGRGRRRGRSSRVAAPARLRWRASAAPLSPSSATVAGRSCAPLPGRYPAAVRRVLLSFAPVAAAACSTALPESALAALLPLGPGVAERFVLEVEIDSPGLTGTFDGVLVTRPDPPAVRFQLLPDLGAPILDVCATPERVAGVMHGHGELQRWPAADKASAPELLLLFGITLLEQHAQVTR